MRAIIIFLNFFCFIFVSADVPICYGTMTFDIPQYPVYRTFYPDSRDATPQLLPDNYECKYRINVPQGWTVSVGLNLTITNPIGGARITVTDQRQVSENIDASDNFYFIAPGGDVDLSTNSGKMFLGMTVFWKQYRIVNPITMKINVSDSMPFMHSLQDTSLITVTADTRVSLTAISESYLTFDSMLRATLIYDGPNLNSTFIGTGMDLYRRNNQWVSTGNQMTIQILPQPIDYVIHYNPIFIFQDYENTKNLVQLQGLTCKDNGYCGLYPIDASKGPVAIQTIFDMNSQQLDVLTDFIGQGTLEVFVGGATKHGKNSAAIYNAGTSDSYLPQVFYGPLKTYVLQNGRGSLNLTRIFGEFGRTKKFGRKGFIQSNYYKQPNKDQLEGAVISAPEGYLEADFKVKVAYADMTGNAYMELFGLIFDKKNDYHYFNSTNPPDMKNPYILSGGAVKVYYSSSFTETTGMFSRFEVAHP